MRICIAGHAGVGHAFGHSGLVQDDSQGFALAGSILCSLSGVSPEIAEVTVDAGEHSLKVTTASGGTGKGFPARGITPFEVPLLKSVAGENACFPQRCAMKAFGRLYGHGVLEVPVALEYAVAEALMDSLRKKLPGFLMMQRRTEQADDIVGGADVSLGRVPVTVMLTVNGSSKGIGPVENLEGNIPLDFKKTVMEELGILKAPTIVVESKAWFPALEGIEEETFLVRYNRDLDSDTVGSCLEQALEETGAPSKVIDSAFPAEKGVMSKNTAAFSRRLSYLAEELGRSTRSEEKCRLASELSRLVTQDLGGVIFMDDHVHDIYRAAGTAPGTAAVLSVAVPESQAKDLVIPFATEENIRDMTAVITRACELLYGQHA